MKVLVFVIILHVTQHALAVQVEVHEGAESVRLPCKVSFLLEDTTVMWNRYDLNPQTVHRWYEDRDRLDGQNQRYSGRTLMESDRTQSGDLSLILRKPQVSDSGSYTCVIRKLDKELKLRDVELKVKVSKVEVRVEEGSESTLPPCQTHPPLPKDTTVEWSRSEPKPMIVHIYPNSSEALKQQDERFCSRTKMYEDLLKTGDLSLTLKHPTDRDSGVYICTVHRDGDVLRQRVVLHHVREPFPAWFIVLLVLLALGLFAGGAFAVYLWHHFTTVSKVEVHAGAESVLLPFKTKPNLNESATVKWRHFSLKPSVVHVHQDRRDQPDKQDQAYLNRTKMTEDLLETGDLSLTLKKTQIRDSGFYICTFSTERRVWKILRLQVTDAIVEWTRSEPWPMVVHVHQNGSDHQEKQNWYRNRTEMREDQLQNKDLSLSLKDPTLFDSATYTCTVSKDGRVLKKKNIRFHVKDPNQVPDAKDNSGDISSSTPLMTLLTSE